MAVVYLIDRVCGCKMLASCLTEHKNCLQYFDYRNWSLSAWYIKWLFLCRCQNCVLCREMFTFFLRICHTSFEHFSRIRQKKTESERKTTDSSKCKNEMKRKEERKEKKCKGSGLYKRMNTTVKLPTCNFLTFSHQSLKNRSVTAKWTQSPRTWSKCGRPHVVFLSRTTPSQNVVKITPSSDLAVLQLTAISIMFSSRPIQAVPVASWF